MIERIFWDLDEVLMHTTTFDPGQDHERFQFPDEDFITHFVFRPVANLLAFARELIGPENNFILTTSTHDYALKANKLGDLQFPLDNVLAREFIELHEVKTAYGGSGFVPSKFASKNNVLIDDKPPQDQLAKIDFLGLGPRYRERYLEVHPYFGVNFPNDLFEKKVMTFLQRLHNDT